MENDKLIQEMKEQVDMLRSIDWADMKKGDAKWTTRSTQTSCVSGSALSFLRSSPARVKAVRILAFSKSSGNLSTETKAGRPDHSLFQHLASESTAHRRYISESSKWDTVKDAKTNGDSRFKRTIATSAYHGFLKLCRWTSF